MKKNIGILNFQHTQGNYGAVLQASAIEHMVRELGYNVEHIKFLPKIKLTAYKKSRGFIGRVIRKAGFGKYLNLYPFVRNVEVFEDFRCSYLNRTDKSFSNHADLIEIKDVYDAVIVGSDQVWRPEYTIEQPLAFFLSFVGDNCKRISYAASFGLDTWVYNDEEFVSSVKKEIKKFSAISVRESTGVDICNNIFGVDALHVLDPTLLVGREFFDGIIDKDIPNTLALGVVYYVLDVSDVFIQQVTDIGKRLNVPVNNIFHKEINGKLSFNSVPEWLAELRASKLIITDSFHCVCFAILFEKQFIYSANQARGMTRLESLLGILGLEDRISRDINQLSDGAFIESNIDYSKVSRNLNKLRKPSLKFLEDALNS
jgi:hypothetical protein